MKVRLFAVTTVMLLFLAACGGDDGNGNEDTLLTGLSGVVILALVIYFVVRSRKKPLITGANAAYWSSPDPVRRHIELRPSMPPTRPHPRRNGVGLSGELLVES